jgi:hypothetical protein
MPACWFQIRSKQIQYTILNYTFQYQKNLRSKFYTACKTKLNELNNNDHKCVHVHTVIFIFTLKFMIYIIKGAAPRFPSEDKER